jgi:hypothetical protein
VRPTSVSVTHPTSNAMRHYAGNSLKSWPRYHVLRGGDRLALAIKSRGQAFKLIFSRSLPVTMAVASITMARPAPQIVMNA